MKKIFLIFICFITTLILAGCGHNLVTQSKGWGIDISWNQDSMIPNLRLGYWDVSSAMVKENAQATVKSTAQISSDANTGKNNQTQVASKTDLNAKGIVGNEFTLKTGNQVNGYQVQLEKAKNKSCQILQTISK